MNPAQATARSWPSSGWLGSIVAPTTMNSDLLSGRSASNRPQTSTVTGANDAMPVEKRRLAIDSSIGLAAPINIYLSAISSVACHK
jgi:hypothetical protein